MPLTHRQEISLLTHRVKRMEVQLRKSERKRESLRNGIRREVEARVKIINSFHKREVMLRRERDEARKKLKKTLRLLGNLCVALGRERESIGISTANSFERALRWIDIC